MFVGFITSQLLYKFGRRILCLSSLTSMAVIMLVSGSVALFVNQREYFAVFQPLEHKETIPVVLEG